VVVRALVIILLLLVSCTVEKVVVTIDLNNVTTTDLQKERVFKLGKKKNKICVEVKGAESYGDSLLVCVNDNKIQTFTVYSRVKNFLMAEDYLNIKQENEKNVRLAKDHVAISQQVQQIVEAQKNAKHEIRFMSFDELNSLKINDEK
jgi:hypothetical protein